MPFTQIGVISRDVEPIATATLFADHPGPLPPLKNAALHVASGIEGDCPIGAYRILTKELVLNVTSCFGD